MAANNSYFAVIEAGGTKFNCAIVTDERQIIAELRVPTTTPDETLSACVAFFRQQREAGYAFTRMGIASFGPLDLNRASPQFGSITKTPKPHWSHTPLTDYFTDALQCEVVIDTDVNAAALAEYQWGAAQQARVAVYVTIGTGVGGGLVVNGAPVQGLVHPEMGHMLVTPPAGQAGTCPFHANCVEGLVSGTALGKIWQQPAHTFGDTHPAWDGFAQVVAQFSHNLLVTLSAEKIVFGGGVMETPGLLDKIIAQTRQSLNDYIVFPAGTSLEDILVLPGLGTRSGLFGALALLQAGQ
ncbi:ROK family protein [Alteromonas sp. ASW11-19]|uniref:fructokinase n=1 Tax=Alteromonas salexigens TaxID=2982530 RepID=A0ABT2VNW8_9ALTE|nr:ROK family protein [Alteromonas salexigens]MCU7554588.1 ROK family protein [Alteromonas salexigens]